MSKKFLICFFFSIFFIGIISSIYIESKEEYFSDESVLIKMYGNFLTPLEKSNILLYRGEARSAIEIGLEKIEDFHYIFFNLNGKTPGEYSIQIKNMEYLEGNKKIKEDIKIPFNISEGEVGFSVFPGAISTSKNFTIFLKNMKNLPINIEIASSDKNSIYSEKNSYSLIPGESVQAKIIVIPSTEKESLEKLTIKGGEYSREIPVYLEKTREKKKERKISFEKKNVNLSLTTNVQKKYSTALKNIGEEEMSNISLMVSEELSESVSLSEYEINNLGGGESIKIEIYVNTSNNSEDLRGYILATDNFNIYEYLYIEIEIISDYIGEDAKNPEDLFENPFSDTGSFDFFDDASRSDEPNGSAKTVGWIIAIILALVVAWFFLYKYRGSKPSGMRMPKLSKK